MLFSVTAIRSHRTMSSYGNSTDQLLQELLTKVDSLTNDVNALKAKDSGRTYPQKRRRDGGGEGTSGHDGDNIVDRNGDLSDVDDIEVDGSDGSNSTRFQLSEQGEAFLEATFDSRVSYKAGRLRSPNMASLTVSGRPVPSYLGKS